MKDNNYPIHTERTVLSDSIYYCDAPDWIANSDSTKDIDLTTLIVPPHMYFQSEFS